MHNASRIYAQCNMTNAYAHAFTWIAWTPVADLRVQHDWFICVSLLIRTDSCVIWLIHACNMNNEHAHAPIWIAWTPVTYLYVQHDWFICVSLLGLIHTCATTYSHVQHDKRICTYTLLDCLNTSDYLYVQHDLFICVTLLIRTHSYVWHDVFIYATCQTNMNAHLFRFFEKSVIHTCIMTYSYMFHTRNMTYSYMFHMRSNMTDSYLWHD